MKFIFFVLITLLSFSCKSQQEITSKSSILVEVLVDSTGVFNELSSNSKEKSLKNKLNSVFQSLSENENISSTNPEERLIEKIALFDICKNSLENCNYIPEGYLVTQNNKLLNVKYQYNVFSGYDLFFKYALIDLSSGNRIGYEEIFSKPEIILGKFNGKYIEENESYLNKFDLSTSNEDELDEYEIIKSHLEDRTLFGLDDLNNLELIFNSELKEFTEIRIHYNGLGGVYKNIITNGYISFKLEEIKLLITPEFIKKIKKNSNQD